ncbi:hypothetical protein C8R43DRAFT_1137927 [Mycena crocata]|nr:hypothetical protein C8R43DRAFT_1137927 [Mycena crocata]
MNNRGSNPQRGPIPPLQARRIRMIAISFPILVVSGYAILDRWVNGKQARPVYITPRTPEVGIHRLSTQYRILL